MIAITTRKERLTCPFSEPLIRIEPMTYALRGGFRPSTAVHPVTSALLTRVLDPAYVHGRPEPLLADPLATPTGLTAQRR